MERLYILYTKNRKSAVKILAVFKLHLHIWGYAVAQLVESLRVRFPVESLEFFSDLILPVALWP